MRKFFFFNYPIFYIALVALLLCLFSSCTKFTDVKVLADNGVTYQAHVIQPRMTVPDTGTVIPIIDTDASDGWLYNSNDWTKEDEHQNLAGLCYRKVVFGKVVEIIPAEHKHN